jgi:hypothetical protein
MGFPREPCQTVSIGCKGGRQQLEGDVPAQSAVTSAINLSHATSANQFQELKMADALSRFRTGSGNQVRGGQSRPVAGGLIDVIRNEGVNLAKQVRITAADFP